RKLELKSREQWKVECGSGRTPRDIPANPNRVYADTGWNGWGDWLGTGRRKGGWGGLGEDRAFWRKLGRKFGGEWSAYCSSGKKPNDIPVHPERSYADDGWNGWGDWLGTGRRKGGWRRFEEARAFVHKLRLKSERDWRTYYSSGKKPNDIPANPSSVY